MHAVATCPGESLRPPLCMSTSGNYQCKTNFLWEILRNAWHTSGLPALILICLLAVLTAPMLQVAVISATHMCCKWRSLPRVANGGNYRVPYVASGVQLPRYTYVSAWVTPFLRIDSTIYVAIPWCASPKSAIPLRLDSQDKSGTI